MNNPPPSMKGFAYTPIDPSWLMESAAFLSDNPKVVRAAVRLLNTAWAAEPAGSVPADHLRLGAACGLTSAEVGEHYESLTEGYELRGGRLHHIKMSELCGRIAEKFGDVIERLADQAAALPQSPEDFALEAPKAESRTKGRRLLPSNFGRTPSLDAFLTAHGFETDADKDFIVEKFVLHSKKGSDKWNDWDAAFKNFAMKEDRRNLPSSRGATVVPLMHTHGFGGRAGRYGNGGETAANLNASRMAQAGAVIREGAGS
jgi:hypothetical protein